jgi:hypothetical protein
LPFPVSALKIQRDLGRDSELIQDLTDAPGDLDTLGLYLGQHENFIARLDVSLLATQAEPTGIASDLFEAIWCSPSRLRPAS